VDIVVCERAVRGHESRFRYGARLIDPEHHRPGEVRRPFDFPLELDFWFKPDLGVSPFILLQSEAISTVICIAAFLSTNDDRK